MTSGKVCTPWIRPLICRHQPCPFEAGLTGDTIKRSGRYVAAASSWFENVFHSALLASDIGGVCLWTPADQASVERQLQSVILE